jgi:pimeloyl-ACP methyl ester carboxylesterase
MRQGCRLVLLIIALAAFAAFAAFAVGRAAAEDRIELHSRPDVTLPILFQPATSPVASVVLYPGGSGVVAAVQRNFLLRVRGAFSAQGINTVVIDAPSDQSLGLSTDYRTGPEAAQDLAAVIAFLKAKAPAPVWLVGTSRGSMSAANGAARLGPPQVSGLVLTSSVWHDGVDRVNLDLIAVPTLIVHNRDDACRKSPPAFAEPALAALTAAPAKQLVLVSGGTAQGNPCGALSAHGYYGIENQVVPVVIAWIKDHTPPAH